ncbi:hypothetical protein L9F63_011156, partial [Diploptera punctata]
IWLLRILTHYLLDFAFHHQLISCAVVDIVCCRNINQDYNLFNTVFVHSKCIMFALILKILGNTHNHFVLKICKDCDCFSTSFISNLEFCIYIKAQQASNYALKFRYHELSILLPFSFESQLKCSPGFSDISPETATGILKTMLFNIFQYCYFNTEEVHVSSKQPLRMPDRRLWRN